MKFQALFVSLILCQASIQSKEVQSDDFTSEGECSIIDENIEIEDIDWSLNQLSQDDPKLIQILKEKYLIRPNNKPLNLTRMPSKNVLNGQYGQPVILDEKIFRGKKKNGFFVEAGAFDGEYISNSLYFELKHQWTGLLVEPNLWYYDKLLQKNRQAWSIGHCLSSQSHPEVVLFDNAADASGVINTETNAKPTLPTYKGSRKTIQKQCFPLYSILLALGNPTVDYLSLDVEGTEIGILKTIPWEKVDIRVVGIEINHLGEIFEGDVNQLDELMFKNGYEYFGNVKIDSFYVKKKTLKKKKTKK